MSHDNASVLGLCSAVALIFLAATPAPAQSVTDTVTDTVTNAFETVVIDATTAASKAADAAKEALADEPAKKKRKKSADTAEKKSADKAVPDTSASKTTAEGKPPVEKTAETPKDGKSTADKAAAGKPADSAKPGDPAAKDPAADKAAADAAKKPPPEPTEWPAVEVELAKARCTQLLNGVDAVTVPEPPFRKGDCGSMAPVRLISVGKSPEVTFSPPAVVSCDLVVTLAKWIKEDVQVAAKRHLGSEVIRVESMSDYSCRMAYGRVGNKLSEHGKANALDIRGFITAKGTDAVVLDDWGETVRDVKKRLLAAKAASEKAEAARVAAAEAGKDRAVAAAETATAAHSGSALPRKTLVEGVPGKTDLAVPASVTKNGPLADATPASLGGDEKKARKKDRKDARQKGETVAALPSPGAEGDEVAAPAPNTPTSRFLHEIHAAGCRIFGTTLGPEANEAHRNHFHVDMAERKIKKICD
ncbi:MAG: extensin family protein [Hyphomicrobium sp.]|uniref:extensin family protein n=1 Tax=Hyphomicrobium sp. TaxID=82 RepID=UPI003D0E8481